MMNQRATGIYRALFHCYPSRFRREYADDMALLFEDQLRDEMAARVWARALLDLAITIPTQHLEARVNRPANPVIPAVFAALSGVGMLIAAVTGARGGTAGIALAVALGSGLVAVAAWRRTRTITGAQPASAHWWKLVAAGGGLFAATFLIAELVGEAPDGWWLPMMLSFLVGVTTLLTGLVLGVARLTSHRPADAS